MNLLLDRAKMYLPVRGENLAYYAPGPRRSRRNRRRYERRSLNFERYASEANYIINQVADELDVNRNAAARITRSVLHAVRDRLPADDAVEFAQGLPIALKGVYFDQYDLSLAPVSIRHPEDFIDYVRQKDGRAAMHDFPTREHVEDGISAVFRVLERNMDYGQVEQIKRLVNDEMAYMFY
jgi:uncharacterized protein (DUF2267 family)